MLNVALGAIPKSRDGSETDTYTFEMEPSGFAMGIFAFDHTFRVFQLFI